MIDPTATRLPEVTTRPGQVLPFALPMRSPEVGLAILAVTTGGFAGYWLFRHFTEVGPGRPSLQLVPIPLIALVFALWQTWISHQFKNPSVEVSTHPLQPGAPVELLVTQEGPAKLRNISARLVCRKVQHSQDHNRSVTGLDEIFLFDICDVDISADTPWTQRMTIAIPEHALGSSIRGSVDVRWYVELTAKGALRWPQVTKFEVLMAWRILATPPEAASA